MAITLFRSFGRFAGAALAVSLLASLPSRAVVVTVGGNLYDVLVTNRSYDADPSLFSTAFMPWFTGDAADNSLAYDFAAAVFDQLGHFSYAGFADPGGPLFAYATHPPSSIHAVFQDVTNLSVQNEITVLPSEAFNYAYATPVPAPLPLIGVSLAYRFSRRLRSSLNRMS
jgi:hypothetical protein